MTKIAITGASGLIGSAIQSAAIERGWDVLSLVRDKPRDPDRQVFWDYRNDLFDWSRLEGCRAIVHLGGANIADGRWTAARRTAIRDSRVRSTQYLCQSVLNLMPRPEVFVCASAIGFYGDRDDEILTEQSGRGEGFLSDVCHAWEQATGPAAKAGVRVVNLRLGMVLAANGGALAKMVPLFRKGLGGKLGSGRQYVSWIALEDVVRIVLFAIDHPELAGPVNVTAPNPVTNAQFTAALAAALHRPAILPAPAFGLKLLLGQMADELLLASTRALPARLVEAGYTFRHSAIGDALEAALD